MKKFVLFLILSTLLITSCSYEKRLTKWSARVPSKTDTLYKRSVIFSNDTISQEKVTFYHDTLRIECPNDMAPVVHSGTKTIVKKIGKNDFEIIPVGKDEKKTISKSKTIQTDSSKVSKQVLPVTKPKKHPGLHWFLYLLGLATIPTIKLIWKLIKVYIKIQLPW